MKLAGKVVSETGNPVAGAKLDIFDGLTQIAGVNSSANGEFSFATDTLPSSLGWKVVVHKSGFALLERDIAPGGSLELELMLKPESQPAPFRAEGKVIDYRKGRPIAEAKVGIFEGASELAGVRTNQAGRFDVSAESAGASGRWRIVVTKDGYLPFEQRIHSNQETNLVLKITAEPIPWWEKVQRWWQEATLTKRTIMIGSALVILIVLALLVIRPFHPRSIEVRVSLKSPNINTNLTLITTQRISRVSVRLNDEREQEFRNLTHNPVIIDVPLTLNALRFATVQINDQEPRKYVFTKDLDGKWEEAVKRIHESFVAVERICVAMTALADVRKKPKPDPKLQQRAEDALDYWKREYSAQLTALVRDYRQEDVTLAGERFRPGGPYSEQQSFYTVMLPLMGRNIASIKSKGKLPDGFENEIYKDYGKLTNSIRVE